MITFNRLGLYGLFGNQMFQYATLYAIAKTRGYEFGVPYSNTGDIEFTNFFLPNCFNNLSAKDSSNFIPSYRAMEQSFEYNAGIFGVADNTDICGYFQSEKYFFDYKNNLLHEFTFNDNVYTKALDIRSLSKLPAISIHLRLGDYLIAQECHPVCSLEYYTEALKLLPNDLLIYVFSNDIPRATEFFKSINRKMVFVENTNKYIDMCLMTMCNYHIIANSSFSWWGAWLSNSKQVIAPSKWFGPANHMPKNWSDVYCEKWIVI
jgi:hypothetical protein